MIKTPVSFDVGDDNRWVVVGENGYHLPIEFAPEVVRRVNAHEALVAALEKMIDILMDVEGDNGPLVHNGVAHATEALKLVKGV